MSCLAASRRAASRPVKPRQVTLVKNGGVPRSCRIALVLSWLDQVPSRLGSSVKSSHVGRVWSRWSYRGWSCPIHGMSRFCSASPGPGPSRWSCRVASVTCRDESSHVGLVWSWRARVQSRHVGSSWSCLVPSCPFSSRRVDARHVASCHVASRRVGLVQVSSRPSLVMSCHPRSCSSRHIGLVLSGLVRACLIRAGHIPSGRRRVQSGPAVSRWSCLVVSCRKRVLSSRGTASRSRSSLVASRWSLPSGPVGSFVAGRNRSRHG